MLDVDGGNMACDRQMMLYVDGRRSANVHENDENDEDEYGS